MSGRWLQLREFIVFVLRHFEQDQCRQHAAALTYTTLFAVVPIMTVAFTILSAIPSLASVSADIQSFVFRHFVPTSGEVVQRYLQDFSHQANKLTVVGIGILFVTAIMMLVTIERAFNQIWRVREPRKGVVGFLRYWAVLSLGPLLLGAGFVISSYFASLELLSSAADVVHGLTGLKLMPFLSTSAAFTLLYVAVPNCKVPLKAGLIGGVVAALLFEAAKRGFGLFVTSFSSYTFVYGAFAAFPVFLLWLFLSWLIVLLGVEFTRALVVFRQSKMVDRHPLLVLMDLLALMYDRQQRGEAVSDVEAMKAIGVSRVEDWAEYVDILERGQFIQRTDDGDYVLVRDLSAVNLADFIRRLPWPLPLDSDLASLPLEQPWAQSLRPLLTDINSQLNSTLDRSLVSLLRTGER